MADDAYIRSMLNCFLVLGGNNNGRINYYKVVSLLSEKMNLSSAAVAELLESNSCRKGDEFDFLRFCCLIVERKIILDKVSSIKSNTEPNVPQIQVNSRTFTRRKGSGQSNSAKLRNRKFIERGESKSFHAENLKGCFINAEDFGGLCANRYVLEITENAPVEIIAQAINIQGCCTPVPVIEVLLFLENDEPNKKLVGFSSNVNCEGYCSIKVNLKKGKYLVVPISVNWTGDTDSLSAEEMQPLISMNDDDVVIVTNECQNALKTVFSCIDMDRNGLLNQKEFDLFMEYTCGESAADEWPTVEDNFDTFNGELTLDGFLSLYKVAIIAEPLDVIGMFKKMGFNNFLEQDKGLQFLLTVAAKGATPLVHALPIANFDSLMDEVFRKIALEQGYCSKVQNMKDVALYTHKLPQRATVVIENQSHSAIKLRLDCSSSVNCVSHRGDLNYFVEVPPRTNTVGHHLLPANYSEPWAVHCVEAFV